ncbi:MAG: radical SAM protein, partial [Nitrospinaceae bacterium]
MKTALVFPPQWYPSQPYLALPTLTAYLQAQGHEVEQFDFNVESYDKFLTRGYLEQCVETVRRRLSRTEKTESDREAEPVFREILSDTDYLESVLSEVEDAKNILRDEERFFQFPVYKRGYTTLKVAMKLISYAHYPSRLDLESFFMQGNPEENLEGILSAIRDTDKNPFISMYEDHLLGLSDWTRFGLVGISIIHVGQVIPALTLSRLLREKYPHLHLVIGGSVFARHANILDNKQILFEEIFHSIILFEGEHPLDQ